MHCTNCGAKLPENANFCVACGTKVVVDNKIDVQPRLARQHLWWSLGMALGACIVAVVSILISQSSQPAGSSSDVAVGGELDDSALADSLFVSNNFADCSVWERTIGEVGTFEVGISVMQTSDEGFIVAGKVREASWPRAGTWLIRTDRCGNPIWDRILTDIDCGDHQPLAQTQDGGYIVTGVDSGSGVMALAKTDAHGNMMWLRHPGLGSYNAGRSVIQTSDDGYVIVGDMDTLDADLDMFVLKVDSDGYPQWHSAIGGNKNEWVDSVVQTSDGGYAVLGSSHSYGVEGICMVLVKLDSAGNQQWHSVFDDSLGAEISRFLVQSSDGGYFLCGSADSHDVGDWDIRLVKADSQGNKVWDATFGGPEDESAGAVSQASDGGCVVVGSTMSYGAGATDMWLIKTDANGNMLWDKTLGTAQHEGYSFTMVEQTSDGGYILVTSRQDFEAGEADIWLVKTDAYGNFE